VLALRPEGLELVEVAPGVDIEPDILARADFKPLNPRDPAEMDAHFQARADGSQGGYCRHPARTALHLRSAAE